MRIQKMGWLLIGFALLAGCKLQTQGSIDLRDGAGEPYSFAGAAVTLFPLNAAAVMPGQSKTVLATGTVAPEDGAVTLTANRTVVRDSRLYAVQFTCPPNVPDDGCEVATPVHVVLTEADLKAGGWRATALTEAAFHAVSYGAAARFSAADLQQVLDEASQALLALPYQDLLQWNPDDTTALRRPDLLAPFSTALAEGIANNDLKQLVQQWLSPGAVAWKPSSLEFIRDLVITEPYVFLLRVGGSDNASGLNVLDVRNPHAPVLVKTLGFSFLEIGNELERQGEFIYVVTDNRSSSDGTLRIVNVSDPLHPALVGSLPMEGDALSLAVDGDYAYVVESHFGFPGGFNGVRVVDIRNPQQPVLVASLELSAYPGKLVKSGSHLFVSGYGGLSIVDVSNPLAPVLAGELPRRYGGAIAVAGDHVFLRHDDAGLDVVDVSNVTAPVLLTTLNMDWANSDSTFGPIESILIEGNDAYIAFGGLGLHRVDISDPAAPRWAGSLDNPDGINSAVALSQGLAYVATGTAGLRILDANALHRNPVLAGSLDLPGRLTAQTVANPLAAYSPILGFGISIIDLWHPRAPELAATYNAETLQVSLAGRFAYLADFTAFHVLDIFNPWEPVALPGTINMNERGFRYLIALDVAGDFAYVTGAAEGGSNTGRLAVIDIRDPQMPILSGQLNFSGIPGEVVVQDDRAYVVVANSQLQVVDLQNPLQPLLAGSLNLPCTANFLAAEEDHVYVACGDGGVQILDVSDLTAPILATTVDTAGSASTITLDGQFAYVADAVGGVVLIDVADPAAPVVIGNASVRGSARGAFVQNGLLYVSTSAGLDVLKKPRVAANSN